ncbi:MAG TPA: ABC transporter permease [Candidatus Saccharimonadales bacterium]|nr:ABC transporter permease [Candidatus Saccharimonadales bacterium]
MKTVTSGHLKAGLDSVRGAKLRNFWTMLGVIIGVASVITVVSIGEGIKQQVGNQIHQFGKDIITIKPAPVASGSHASSLGPLAGLNVSGTLGTQDLVSVAQTRGVAASAPLTALSGQIRSDNGTRQNDLVIGTGSALPRLLNQSLAYGSFFDDDSAQTKVAILGPAAAETLFDEDVPLGRSFTFHGQPFIVQGIFNSFDSTPLSPEADFNHAIFIPNQVAQSLTNNTAPIYEILAKPRAAGQVSIVAAALRQSLNRSHGGQSNLSVLAGNQNLGASDTILELLTRLIAGAAAISLLVGGVGIMDVMLVSVTERMHEIGIRKAVGATNRQILSQFVIESTILSLTGGVIGIIVAAMLDLGLHWFTNLRPLMDWPIVVLATVVSLLVGVIFGSIPALKAARKNPIEALRSE